MGVSDAPRRIVVAMSGGVDSAVAAARLFDQGHEVIGVTLHLWDYPSEADVSEGKGGGHGRCCAPEDQYDAQRMADAIGFPHYTFDRRALFAETVVLPFVNAYVEGETPSPCTACNRGVKMRELFAIADRLGATHVATGHYARVGRDASDTPFLATGLDSSKDQSYFLYATPREQLERLVFPLGESHKSEVRAEAVKRQLPGAAKGESQELCFVGSGQHAYARFVEERAAARLRPGPIVDESGRVVGSHGGVHRFTVGQRKGLGVALGAPAFVARVDAKNAAVHLATHDERLMSVECDVDDVVLAPGVCLPRTATVRVRYRHQGEGATVVLSRGNEGDASGSGGSDEGDAADGRRNARGADGASESGSPRQARVLFDGPVRAVTAGQIAVFYEGERVLGGGRIVRSLPSGHGVARHSALG